MNAKIRVSTGQQMLRIDNNHQNPGERQEAVSLSERINPVSTLILDFWSTEL